MTFSRDGALVATAASDHTVRLWDTTTGHQLHTIAGHTGIVWSVAFSPDGTLLASASDDGTVRLWRLDGHRAPTLGLTLLALPDGWAALAPDGRYKLEGDPAGRFWHAIDRCRFEPGELDDYLPQIRRLADHEAF